MDQCDNCKKEVNSYDLHEVINYDADEIQYVCAHCLEYYTKCDQCGMYRPNDLVMFEPETGMYRCNLCQKKDADLNLPDANLDLEEESWRD